MRWPGWVGQHSWSAAPARASFAYVSDRADPGRFGVGKDDRSDYANPIAAGSTVHVCRVAMLQP